MMLFGALPPDAALSTLRAVSLRVRDRQPGATQGHSDRPRSCLSPRRQIAIATRCRRTCRSGAYSVARLTRAPAGRADSAVCTKRFAEGAENLRDGYAASYDFSNGICADLIARSTSRRLRGALY